MTTILSEHQKSILKFFNPTEPVTVPENLKGRAAELSEGMLYLLSGECIIIQGARRIGRTSLLHCLGTLCAKQDQYCIYISFQRVEKHSSKTFAHHLIQVLFSELKVPLTNPEEYDLLTAFKQLGLFVEANFKNNEYIVILIDEFQTTEDLTQNQRRIFYNQLRNVIDEKPIHPGLYRFVFAISTSQSLSELSTGISSTLASAFPKTLILGCISADSCRQLIQEPFIETVKFDNEAIKYITREAGGHPYLLKLLVHSTNVANPSMIFSKLTECNLQEIVSLQSKTLTEDLFHPHFLVLKSTLSEFELEILYEVNKYQKLDLTDVHRLLSKKNKLVGIASIRKGLDLLVNLQIIYKDNGSFAFSNPIYQKWFALFFEQYYEKDVSLQMKVSSEYLENNNKRLRALIMKGGGVKGLAYIGALKELEKYYHFNWFIGTSAGAIAAILLGAGYTLDELESLLSEKNFRDFLDAKLYQLPTNLFFLKGLFPAQEFTAWVDRLLSQKLDSPARVTLGDLPNRVTIYASRRGKDALIFDSYDPKYKDTDAAYAVRCSMSIPFIFVPQRDAGLRVLDGGMQNNYPVEILLRNNPNLEFVGLYLGAEHYEGENKESWLISDLLSIWTESSDFKVLKQYQDQTIIIDPRPISTVDFGLTNDEKIFLLNAGRAASLKFLLKRELINNVREVDAKREEVRLTREQLTIKRRKQRQKRAIIWLAIPLILLVTILLVFLIYQNQNTV